MGKVKLEIKRLENASGRQVTYSKRRAGILKKARELSIPCDICDVDVVLLMFSPTSKPTFCLGEHRNIEEVIVKFAQLTPQERAKRKLENLEALKRTFKKLDRDVDVQDLLGTSTQTKDELSYLSRLLQSQLSEVQERLRNNLTRMTVIDKSFSWICCILEDFGKQQFISLECTGQCSLDELSRNACLRLQVGGQCPYQSYHLNFLCEKCFIDSEMNLTRITYRLSSQCLRTNQACIQCQPSDLGFHIRTLCLCHL
ncbi:agamous-like MADS-box protein AGL65 [Magnolia sinica]|uniref:agamous-like MADS-box protein AGL65 n=1 Tax=Magnolia sinica TaxID=86752 RepID=UPI00265AC503|nr:agamous-like MADS-box protein AGL65 [Magnolia sinica]